MVVGGILDSLCSPVLFGTGVHHSMQLSVYGSPICMEPCFGYNVRHDSLVLSWIAIKGFISIDDVLEYSFVTA